MGTRHIFAGIAACVITGSVFGLAWHWNRTLLDQARQGLREASAAGELPNELKGVDIEKAPLDGLAIKVPAGDLTRFQLANAIFGLWFLWIPAVFAVCIATAYIAERQHRPPAIPPGSDAAPSP